MVKAAHPGYDKLPVTVETTSFRRTSDEYVFTVATQRKHEEYAKTFMARLSSTGVIFFVPASPDELDGLLAQNGDGPVPSGVRPVPSAAGSLFADVGTLAQRLGMTERNVQLQADTLLVRAGRGQYDMLESYALLWRAYKELETGRNKDFNRGRAEKIEKQNRELDRLHLVAMKKLVSAADVQRALEIQNANIRQKFVYLKALAPGLDGRPVNEIEKRLDEYARKCLRELDRSGEADARRPEDAEDAEETGAAPAPRKRRKKAGKGRG